MALNDIVFSSRGVQEENRGNIGSVTDITTRKRSVQEEKLVVPVVTDVKSGIQYGVNGDQLTGTYVGGGGGSNIFVLSD